MTKLSADHSNPVMQATVKAFGIFFASLLGCVILGKPLLPSWKDTSSAIICAFLWFSVEFFTVIGIKVGNSMIYSAWQPLVPIICCLMAVAVGYEAFSASKAFGILLASVGAMTMTVCDYIKHGGDTGTVGTASINTMLLIEVCCYAGFIIWSKGLLAKYPFVSVNMWAWGGSFVFMTVSLVVGHFNPSLLSIYCMSNDEAKMTACLSSDLTVASSSVIPLAYLIIVCGIFASALSLHLTKFVKISVLSIYTSVQPVAVAMLSSLYMTIYGQSWSFSNGIRQAGLEHVAGISIIVSGLFFVCREGLFDEPTAVPCKNTDSGMP